MPSISFTESASEVVLLPVNERVTRPAHEPTSTSGRVSEEEEDEVAVSCTDLRSMITGEDSVRIIAHYSLEVVMPCELERAHRPLVGYVTLLETYLKFGVRFPVHSFVVEVLKYFKLTGFQVTPNGWAHMIELFVLFVERRMGPPTTAEFTWYYSVKSNKNDEGFYYFAKRPSKGLHAIAKIRDSVGPWKEAYFLYPRDSGQGHLG